ncbi:hypothetical protein [Caballeronia cordobensis]|uniref:hypothetical protein n=1 Tax=Caballeronia cordobensis TaxID=1353886 RepID=UPI0006AD5FFC|nr:hypothetical protein [Caballeronia cordobensis]
MKLSLKSWVMFVAASACAVTGHAADADRTFAAAASDYLVQDVCLDAAGKVLKDVSPISGGERCARHRDLQTGEPLSYLRADWPNDASRATQPSGLQRSNSFPVRFGDRTMIASDFDFGTPPRKFGQFGPGDGGQLVALTQERASVVLTEDGKGLKYFYGPSCAPSPELRSLDDSWLLFDQSVFEKGSGSAVAHLRQSLDGASCPAHLDAAYTRWAIKAIPFRRDLDHNLTEALRTIVTDHFSGPKDDAGSVERMYFTRELGWTRWERWQNVSRANDKTPVYRDRAQRVAQSGRCDVRDGPPSGHGEWIMVDCREWTNVQPAAADAGAPEDFWIGRLSRGASAAPMLRALR